ncbi:glycosyl hydrolase family 28-related protein [Chlorogloeopsis fritschii]|uniref:glycosyl hydrolase family 28-related protein n=1 Tax=Chlorogloeopsis fritschii TaxID=1124 RepID=UPI0023F18CF8|nr:glycosyl hydrolase family 28-related protein [Chlorogloeopsis fritschii]
MKTVYGAKGDGTTDDTAALQQALDDLGQTAKGKASVLYLPAGTYRITKQLRLYKVQNIAIIGESPESVTLRWDGTNKGVMLLFENVAYSRLSRLTFDGVAKASKGLWIRWGGYATGDHFPTTFEISDNVFKDLEIGIQGGEDPNVAGHQDTAAEVAIMRCKFFRHSYAGVVLRDWNTLNWWIRNSLFEDNNRGVAGLIGVFHVTNSVFRRSTNADVYAQNNFYIGLRNNYSIGSKHFYLTGGPTGDGINAILQNNTILDTNDIAVSLKTPGPVTLLDNLIRSSAGGTTPAVDMGALSPGNLIAIGNTFTISNPIRIDQNYNRLYSQNNEVVDRSTVDVEIPTLPGTPARSTAPIIEVTQKTGAAVQTAIKKASLIYAGQRPVVHLPAGDYLTSNPITIPAGSDVRIVGDVGYFCSKGCSRLVWNVPTSGSVLRVKGPSKALIQDIGIWGNNTANGILIEGVDQQGGHILLDQALTHRVTNTGTGMMVDGLDHTVINAINHQFWGVSKGVTVLGGSLSADGKSTTAQVNLLGGFSGATGEGPSFHVDNGGRLMVQDSWYEESTRTPMLHLTGSGTVTLNSMAHMFAQNATFPTILIDGFSGKVTLGSIYSSASTITVQGNNPTTNVLLFGSRLSDQKELASNFSNNSTNGHIVTLNNNHSTISGTTEHLSNTATIDNEWLRSMLSQLRQDKLADPTQSIPSEATDLTLQRVGVENVTNGIIVKQ